MGFVVGFLVDFQRREADADLTVVSSQADGRAYAQSCVRVVRFLRRFQQETVLPNETTGPTQDLSTTHITLKRLEDLFQLLAGAVDDDSAIAILPTLGHLFKHLLGQTLFAPPGPAVSTNKGCKLLESRRGQRQAVFLGKGPECQRSKCRWR